MGILFRRVTIKTFEAGGEKPKPGGQKIFVDMPPRRDVVLAGA